MRAARLLAPVLALVLLGACSDSGDSPAPSTSTSANPPATTTRPVDTSFTGQGSAPFCSLAKMFNDRFANLATPTTPAQARANLRDAQAALTQAIDIAPGEIQPDLTVIAAGVAELTAALERVNYDAARLEPTGLAKLQEPAFVTSSVRLQAYLRNVCRVA